MNELLIQIFSQLIKVNEYLNKTSNDINFKRQNEFRIRSLKNGLRTIKTQQKNITSIKELENIPGIGKGIKDRINEILSTKKLVELDIKEKENINCLILSCFINSKLESYDEIIYYLLEDNIIGFIGLNIDNNFININQLCVKYNYRNKGIATKLLKYIEENSIINLILYIDKNKNNTEKLYNFYLKRGYIGEENEIDYKMICTK
jgi:GNAT superfamily N-acetyltransferase